jgi:hypothetical protein
LVQAFEQGGVVFEAGCHIGGGWDRAPFPKLRVHVGKAVRLWRIRSG